MKKLVCLLLCIVLVTASFSGCKAEEEQVTLTVLTENNFLHMISLVQDVVGFLYPNITLEFITLPMDELERQTALQSMRTEIMAGDGPDIFLLASWNQDTMTWDSSTGIEYPRIEPLFKSVEDAMANGVFLDLDEYIEKSEYINMEDHVSVIMDAGKTERGQMVLPLLYSVNMCLVDKSQISDPDAKFETLEDITGNKDTLYTVNHMMEDWFCTMIPEFEDHDNNNLILTEEQLRKAFDYAGKVFQAPENGEYIVFDTENIFSSASIGEGLLYQWKTNPDDVVPIIMRNIDGGITALIEAFVAINGGTDHPDEAFKIAELFFSDEIQSDKGFYAGRNDEDTANKYLAFEFAPESFNKECGMRTGKAAFSEEVMYDYDRVEYVNSLITHVRFTSEFDCALGDAWETLYRSYYLTSQKDSLDYQAITDEMIAELYSDFKMMAAE